MASGCPLGMAALRVALWPQSAAEIQRQKQAKPRPSPGRGRAEPARWRLMSRPVLRDSSQGAGRGGRAGQGPTPEYRRMCADL